MNVTSSPLGKSAAWYALATKPRQEDRAVENLEAWKIPTLAPKLDARAGDRRKLLFPGYIFACFDIATKAQKIRFTRGVSYIVGFGGRPAEVADEIITAISFRIGKNGSVALDGNFQAGDPIVITSGPLQNFQGVFEQELSDSERVRILLTTVAYTARIEISKYDLKKQSPIGARTCAPDANVFLS
jgi:transcriptional antiterminator RfaH